MTENQKLREAFEQGWKMAAEWSLSYHLLADMESQAYLTERDGRLQALALPTAAPVVKESLTVAATVDKQGLPPLPETPYQLYYEWPDDEDGYGGSEVVDGDAYTADQMRAYALSAISSAGKDAERYRMVRRGQHWSVIDYKGDELRAEALDAAADAAIAKRGA
ncbi:MAG: hypothetical protein ACM3VZ_10315 [Acidobacteriota bacterium]